MRTVDEIRRDANVLASREWVSKYDDDMIHRLAGDVAPLLDDLSETKRLCGMAIDSLSRQVDEARVERDEAQAQLRAIRGLHQHGFGDKHRCSTGRWERHSSRPGIQTWIEEDCPTLTLLVAAGVGLDTPPKPEPQECRGNDRRGGCANRDCKCETHPHGPVTDKADQ